jgi:hypothetical protein
MLSFDDTTSPSDLHGVVEALDEQSDNVVALPEIKQVVERIEYSILFQKSTSAAIRRATYLMPSASLVKTPISSK